MRKLVLGLALATTAIATPAFARTGQWYVEGEAGPSILETENIASTNGLGGSLTSKTGADFNVELGYDFGMFRLEAETGYRTNRNKGLTVNGTNTTDEAGKTHVWDAMLNGLVDFGPDDGLQGFVGAGAGVARVSQYMPDANYAINGSTSKFAWQLIAGIRAPISKHVDVGLRYTYFNVDSVSQIGGGNLWTGATVSGPYRQHSFLATLTYNFGATRARTSCSSIGTSRTSPPKRRRSSTTRSLPMATAPMFRSSSMATPTFRVR